MDPMEYESSRNAFEGLSPNTLKNVHMILSQFIQFSNSKLGITQDYTPDRLVKEAQKDVKNAEAKIDGFYNWLQFKPVEGYLPRPTKVKHLVRRNGYEYEVELKVKPAKSSTAHVRAYDTIRTFYSSNRIFFDKKWIRGIPKPSVKEAIRADSKYGLFKLDDKKHTISFDRELMQKFLSNLKLREQAITLALLSSSQDTGILFELNIGDFVNNSNGRFFWDSSRQKTGVQFRTFFSKEATNLVRRYIDQERRGAEDNEPLFIMSKNGDEPIRMRPDNLSKIYREAAKRMGVQWKSDQWNPFRPKRLRHLFRTACDNAGIDELYINAFMGHKNSQGQDYSETDPSKLELEYLQVEPFVTVYGSSEETNEMKEDVTKLSTTVETLSKTYSERLQNQQKEIEELRSKVTFFEDTMTRFDELVRTVEDLKDFTEFRSKKSQ